MVFSKESLSDIFKDFKSSAGTEFLKAAGLILLAPLYHWVLRWIGPTAGWERVVAFTVPFAFAYGVLLTLLRVPRGRSLHLSVSPTSGPAQELFLNVTNEGDAVTLSATGEIIACNDDPNPMRGGAFPCGWEDGLTQRTQVNKGETARILIASLFTQELPSSIPDRMLGANILSLGKKEWWTFRWFIKSEGTPPSYRLRIRVVGALARYPREYFYILRPKHNYRPLELAPAPKSRQQP